MLDSVKLVGCATLRNRCLISRLFVHLDNACLQMCEKLWYISRNAQACRYASNVFTTKHQIMKADTMMINRPGLEGQF